MWQQLKDWWLRKRMKWAVRKEASKKPKKRHRKVM